MTTDTATPCPLLREVLMGTMTWIYTDYPPPKPPPREPWPF